MLVVTLNFLEKHAVPLPRDWETMEPVENCADDLVKKLTGANSFYYVLASTTRHNKKSLRDCTQALSKFIVISRVYSLTWREAFLIFNMLMNQVNKLEQPQIPQFVSGVDFSKRWMESSARMDDLEEMPSIFKNNFQSFLCFQRFRGHDQKYAALYKIYENLEKSYVYSELRTSIEEKFDFIKDFDLEVSSDS